MAARTIRIFASSPDDVQDERGALEAVVAELGETLRAFAPEKEVGLELVRWETHTHPDIAPGSSPQAAVDAQIPPDFDVFVGVMWTRFGTPTPSAGSGTEHEFRQAYERRRTTGRPAHILFYFCQAPPPYAAMMDNAEQIALVREFRKELSGLGLVGAYEDRTLFAEQVRRDLTRLISTLIHSDQPPAAVAERSALSMSHADRDVARARVAAVAAEYDRVRDERPSSDERTRIEEQLATQLRTLAQDTYVFIDELLPSRSGGLRLAAIAALQAFPDVRRLEWLEDRVLRDDHAFLRYQATVALLAAANELPRDDLPALRRTLTVIGHPEMNALSGRMRTLGAAREAVRRRLSEQ
jgi:hypothetical protein